MDKNIDILIFGGQSNMQGETECLPSPNDPVENALEYKYLSNSLVPLVHPVGEDIEDGLLWGADKGFGSLLPDFCRAYVANTGKTVVAIHAARGATMVSEWLKGTPRYDCALKKVQGGIEAAKQLGEIDKIYYIWLQGESDAIFRTSGEDYKKMLTAYKNDLKVDMGIHKFGIIEVGYFCGTVRWLQDRTKDEGRMDDEIIMTAQEQIVEEDNDFVMLTQICKDLSLNAEYINPFADGHYNNKAMARIGQEAGTALAKL